MFKLDPDPQFTHKVDVMVPVDGGHLKQTFRATFRVVDTPEEGAVAPDLNTSEGSTAFLRQAIVSLDDLVGADDQPVGYSDALRDQLLRRPFVRHALFRTYLEAISKAPLGN